MSEIPQLSKLLKPENRVTSLSAATAEGVVAELLTALGGIEDFPDGAVESMTRAILQRERHGTTGIGNGVAIPHMKNCPHVSSIRAILGRAEDGIDFAATDGALCRLFFLILVPEGGEDDHIQAMRKVVRLSRDRKTINYLLQADEFGNLDAILREIDEQ